ncbi:MAG: ATP-binding cassette domain-containing protein [Defluviitaleaceae bacterium]|nr:ATP-binding cassette domain-containing protein [Defluviitaleaceae bacterium]
MEIITVKSLYFQYEKEPILKNVSFDVKKGEFICVAGINGSGKSTLLKLLLRLLKPTLGCADVLTNNVAYLAQRASAFNPDFPATVAEIVSLGIPIKMNIGLREQRKTVDNALKQMDMLDYRNQSIGRLSGGQQQRVLLAKALVKKPDLIILDEPTVGMDNGAATQICCLLGKLNKKENATLIMVTHDVPLILNHADRILQFEKGGIKLSSPKDFYQNIALHD